MKDAGNTENSQEKRVARHYAMLASKYDRKWDRYTRVSLGTMFDHLTLRGDEKILDCACGTGRLAAMMREKHPNIRIAGTDLSPDMLAVLANRCRRMSERRGESHRLMSCR
jgi:ubiquinone/menaquinone biosynthesis C-methylase UbiE